MNETYYQITYTNPSNTKNMTISGPGVNIHNRLRNLPDNNKIDIA